MCESGQVSEKGNGKGHPTSRSFHSLFHLFTISLNLVMSWRKVSRVGPEQAGQKIVRNFLFISLTILGTQEYALFCFQRPLHSDICMKHGITYQVLKRRENLAALNVSIRHISTIQRCNVTQNNSIWAIHPSECTVIIQL